MVSTVKMPKSPPAWEDLPLSQAADSIDLDNIKTQLDYLNYAEALLIIILAKQEFYAIQFYDIDRLNQNYA
ncbi:MAG: hypothetical protein F6K56_10015, partial [Moorea sp. SIO3G5]|nr:hypothetical protein [Moorena sp. SIO3G5]